MSSCRVSWLALLSAIKSELFSSKDSLDEFLNAFPSVSNEQAVAALEA
jgi:hypothetical protein